MSDSAKELPYLVIPPKGPRLPILISVPHSGTAFPPGIKNPVKREFLSQQPDTDWLVHELYGFAQEMGITLIHARYSRYLIDLNRDPAGGSLYSDGRQETALVPRLTFAGTPIYEGDPPDALEVKRRVEAYHAPYYSAVEGLLAGMRREHRQVLFYDAHSIRRVVKSISSDPFPDLILGSKDGSSAAGPLIQQALDSLSEDRLFEVSHNKPFKGGQLTRHFGQPGRGIHALQLEMAQDVYLDEPTLSLHPVLAPRMQNVLRKTLIALARTLGELP
jgi:N-formylglutamate deformylase